MFREELRKLRIKTLKKQAEMAKELNVPYETYKTWERGFCLPSFENYEKILTYAKKNHYFKGIEQAYIEEKKG